VESEGLHADEAVLKKVLKKSKKSPFERNKRAIVTEGEG
jgi:hypothetical protein